MPEPQPQPDAEAQAQAPEPKVPLAFWLVTGGTGPRPTFANFRRMASERKAMHREEVAYKKTKQAAQADFKEKFAPIDLKTLLGITKREKPERKELMRLYGPDGAARGRAWGERSDGSDGGGGGDASAGGDAAATAGDIAGGDATTGETGAAAAADGANGAGDGAAAAVGVDGADRAGDAATGAGGNRD